MVSVHDMKYILVTDKVDVGSELHATSTGVKIHGFTSFFIIVAKSIRPHLILLTKESEPDFIRRPADVCYRLLTGFLRNLCLHTF